MTTSDRSDSLAKIKSSYGPYKEKISAISTVKKTFYLTDDTDTDWKGDTLYYAMGKGRKVPYADAIGKLNDEDYGDGERVFTNTWHLDSPEIDWDLTIPLHYGYFREIHGSLYDDTINGGPTPEYIYASFGDDLIIGNLDPLNTDITDISEDTLLGGRGDDIIIGSAATDYLGGDEGQIMGTGNDFIITGDLSNGQSDYVTTGEGTDTVVLGQADNGFTIPAEGFDWLNYGFTVAKDISNLAFTVAHGGAADKNKAAVNNAKAIVPLVVDVIQAIEGYDGEATVVQPTTGEYATVDDFDFRTDTIIVPVNDGVSNVFVTTDDTNGENDLAFRYDVGGGIFATINFPSSLTSTASEMLADQLTDNALMIDASGAALGSNSDDAQSISLTNSDQLSTLGNKFYVFGAWGPQVIDGSNEADYLYGTDYSDIIAGYSLKQPSSIDEVNENGEFHSPETSGEDQLFGYDGDDVFLGGSGFDRFSGGDGTDYASYIDSTDGIIAQLGYNSSSPKTDSNNAEYLEVTDDGFGDKDYLYSVENIIGSGHEDTVSYSEASSGVEVKVYNSDLDKVPADGETNVLVDVENITGSDNSDTIDFSNLDGPLTLTMNVDGSATAVNNYDIVTLTTDVDGNETFDNISGSKTYWFKNFEKIIGSAFEENTLVPSGQVNLDNLDFENIGTIQTGSVLGTGDPDSLEGSSLNDFITGGNGVDTLTGGDGADIFYFSSWDFQPDYVTDFDPSEGDIILADSWTYQSPDNRNVYYSQDGDNVKIGVGGVNVGIIEGVSVNELDNTGYVTNSLPDWMTSQGIEVQSAL